MVTKTMTKAEKIEDIAKRRGIFWQSGEIYGGLSGFYDYGHLGYAIKKRFENLWRSFFLNEDNVYEIESCNIMPEGVFIASGHITNFVDPVAKCKKCGIAHRADHIMEDFLHENFEGLSMEKMTEIIRKHNVKCPRCKGELAEVGILNMMFPITLGTGDGIKAYLRPETAQGPYVNFKREFECLRKQMPLGLAMIGKAFRNEISPRNLLIRQREFTQAELQIFFDPETINIHPSFEEIGDYKLLLYTVADRTSDTITEISCRDAVKKLHLPQFYVYHMAKIQRFYLEILGLQSDKFRFHELNEEERAFYNKLHWDIELFIESLGKFTECAGLHYRTDHDLSGHAKISKQDLSVNIEGHKFVPHVLELSFGVDRNIYAFLDLALKEEIVKDEERTILIFPRLLAPYDCAIFPLMNKDNLPSKAKQVKEILKESGFDIFYDGSGSIGRRYRRMDEIGVSLCITVDYDTMENDTVTLRDRDSMKQIRAKIEELPEIIKKYLHGEDIENLGEVVERK
ncbi:MAG: glycine--tRNA ligase [Candidatus Aenigmatarchaeota archaeon]